MGDYKPLPLKDSEVQQKFDLKHQTFNSFYRKLKLVSRFRESLPISDLSLSSDNKLSISSGTKVSIYNCNSNSTHYNYTGSKSFIRSTSFRSDGKLLSVSNESGEIHLIAVPLKSLLRKFTDHKSAVYTTQFSSDKTHLISGSDDKTTKFWDITQSKCVTTFSGHTDKVRSVAVQGIDTNIFGSGSYDSTALIYDTRTPSKSLFELNHGSPIESINFSAEGSTFVTAGSNGYANIYDINSGFKLVNQLKLHTKAITNSLLINDLLVTSSLDTTIKFTKYNNNQVDHIYYTDAPVRALTISLDGNTIAYGTESGEWCMRVRRSSKVVQLANKSTVAVQGYRPGNLSRLDRLLKTFRYQTALDVSLDLTVGHTLSLIEELIVRGGLEVAVTKTDDQGIIKLLNFINSHLGINSASFGLLLELLDALIDKNGWICQSNNPEIASGLRKIKQKLGMELHQRQIIHQMIGTIEYILSSV